jgi:hypothetical protein
MASVCCSAVLKPAGEEEPQVISLPNPSHQATTDPQHSSKTAPSSSAHTPSPHTPQETALPQDEAQQERIADGANAGPSGQEGLSDDDDDEVSDKQMYGSRTIREVCEKLIEVFMVEKPEVMDWKRLLTLSSEWANIRPKFYTHIKKRAKEVEEDGNHKYALQLYSLQRRLSKVRWDAWRIELVDCLFDESRTEFVITVRLYSSQAVQDAPRGSLNEGCCFGKRCFAGETATARYLQLCGKQSLSYRPCRLYPFYGRNR